MTALSPSNGPMKTFVDLCMNAPAAGLAVLLGVSVYSVGENWCETGKKMRWIDTDSGQVCACVEPKKKMKKK